MYWFFLERECVRVVYFKNRLDRTNCTFFFIYIEIGEKGKIRETQVYEVIETTRSYELYENNLLSSLLHPPTCYCISIIKFAFNYENKFIDIVIPQALHN